MAALEIFTESYEEVHGRKPRGQGVWSFFIVSTRGTDFNEPLTYHGTYSDALMAAKREARSRGIPLGAFRGRDGNHLIPHSG